MSHLAQDISSILHSIERSMSTYLQDSELSGLNRFDSTDWYSVSYELCSVIAAATDINSQTNGVFDITIGPVVNLWGFGPDGEANRPETSQVQDRLMLSGPDSVIADCSVPAVRKKHADVYLDLSAIAKGYAVDRIADLLSEHGFSNYLVEIGGEVRVAGRNATDNEWRIAIESPTPSNRTAQLVLPVSNAAIATSGDYRNFFDNGGRRYSHVIDPRSGFPVTHRTASVTVITDTAMMADAYATALMVMGSADGLSFAEQQSLAAFFLVRIGDKIFECASSAFPYQGRNEGKC